MFDEFDSLSEKAWREKIQHELKGKDFEDLFWSNGELQIEPFYRLNFNEHYERYNLLLNFLRQGLTEGWSIKERFSCKESSNEEILSALECNTSSIHLNDLMELEKLLEGVFLDMIRLNVAHEDWPSLLTYLQKTNYTKCNITVDYSPLSQILRGEINDNAWIPAFKNLKSQLKEFSNSRLLCIDVGFFEDCGATIVQQLAYAISLIHGYYSALDEESIDDLSALTHIQLNIGSSYFLEIAKCRAMRILFGELLNSFSPRHNCSLHSFLIAKTSKLIKGNRDPESNLIRNSIAGMAASLGSCDEIEIAFSPQQKGGRRIARNIQNLIKEESYLDQVIDIPKGSHYIDKLTFELVRLAWDKFMRIEAQGGFFAALDIGQIQDELKEVALKKVEALNQGQQTMVGENKYLKSNSQNSQWSLIQIEKGFNIIQINA